MVQLSSLSSLLLLSLSPIPLSRIATPKVLIGSGLFYSLFLIGRQIPTYRRRRTYTPRDHRDTS
ncbi:hypothetical protein BCV70DRAFT_110543 [Testicularia cyperi]|uniref:Uncharacterized protein n=1 Tax=Testicularia cyperi TaxID=1882483 RepID=A0A317XNJ2_9BASI|nr:hypothetical protein BCV70DRAFT_110543 [Testicularia cyperi]